MKDIEKIPWMLNINPLCLCVCVLCAYCEKDSQSQGPTDISYEMIKFKAIYFEAEVNPFKKVWKVMQMDTIGRNLVKSLEWFEPN